TETAPAAPGGKTKAVPAARNLAKSKGIALEALTGTGPDGVILVSDVEAAFDARSEPHARVSTLGRRFAEKTGIPLREVRGTGIRGRIMRGDVETAIQEAAAPALGKVMPMSTIRRVISRRMSESAFTAPHIYFFTDVLMDPLLDFRKEILPDFEKIFGLRPSINDFLIKAVGMNILDFPILNAVIKGDEIHILPRVNVCLAVALPEGLIVPAIADADSAGLVDIVQQRKDLVQRALSGKLTVDELERGTFTISSLSQYDITYFTAIVNPPQSGILSMGKTREELSLVDGEIKVKKVTTMGIGVDHRIIDGAVAADFLQNLKWKLERPSFTFLTL
ncbi:MAG: 2-oxo acid dehydrogenase subunit E2, partial [Deltaproteobacteria bacterium]|nr:2-oxo acid dehydrogenase subunit E2 [Deltaproteobacteria bacterium]